MVVTAGFFLKSVLLIIGGGIAAYKGLELIRRMRERGLGVRVVLTRAALEFVTPLSVGAISNERVFTDLFDLDDEREIGHIRLSREADLVVIAPATADLIARLAHGHANDLATATLLASDKPLLVCPAMNPRMWLHPATQRNVAQICRDGASLLGPNVGEMAERGEAGPGRLAEVLEIVQRVEELLAATGVPSARPLTGRHVLVTSGPTHEPIDPVRYIANRSSGKQGHAIAEAAAVLGARVTLVTGPVVLPDPKGVDVRHVETAQEMLEEVQRALPADIAVLAAAVADWRVAKPARSKLKKGASTAPPQLALMENPDILKTISKVGRLRPALVIGFAAETQTVVTHATAKRTAKGCDWIVANDVSREGGVFGGDANTVHLISAAGVEDWAPMSKAEVAEALMVKAAQHLATTQVSI